MGLNIPKLNKIYFAFASLFLITVLLGAGSAKAYYYDSNIFAGEEDGMILPFGANLFEGQFSADSNSGINPNYIIQPGDEISVSIWGDTDFNESLMVDNQGNIFIPSVGPIKVSGIKNTELTDVVKKAVSKVYSAEVKVYTDLRGANPVSIYVTGAVEKPGRYSGVATDSLLHFLDQAQGVDVDSGSFRQIDIIRNDKKLESFDIYKFLLNGQVPKTQLKDGDIVFVNDRFSSITVSGEVKYLNMFEFVGKKTYGFELTSLAQPKPNATHISVSGFRGGKPVSRYMTIDQFAKFQLEDGDSVLFHSSAPSSQIKVFIEGEVLGPSVVVAPVGSNLQDVLSQVRINPNLSNYKAVQIERAEVAQQQKIALENSLRRLEESVLISGSTTADEQAFKAEEAKLVGSFIENARKVVPKGRIVVSTNKEVKEIILKDGDKVIIPPITNIVLVSGEVSIPGAIVYSSDMSISDYISRAGGYTLRADSDNILVLKANGETVPARQAAIEQGDEIIVLPEIKVDRLSFAKNLMDVIYKMVLSIAVPIKLLED